METIEAIRKMNEKHPAGRRSTCIADLCARVEELEEQLSETREQPRQGPQKAPQSTEVPSFDIGAIRAIAARGDPVMPGQVLALCDEAERWRRQASLWAENIEDLIRERDGLRADAIDIRRKARRYLSVKKSWDNRLHELVVLRAALEAEHPGAPLLALLTAARAWAGAIEQCNGIVAAEQRLLEAIRDLG